MILDVNIRDDPFLFGAAVYTDHIPLGYLYRYSGIGKLISEYTHKEDRVLIGAGIGEDAAIIDMGSRYLVAKTDPITHVTSEIGHYAVNINANDIAAMGGKPMWFLATILMPAASSADRMTYTPYVSSPRARARKTKVAKAVARENS